MLSTTRLHPEWRICYYCSIDECKDKAHLVTRCELYKDIRNAIYEDMIGNQLMADKPSVGGNLLELFLVSTRPLHISIHFLPQTIPLQKKVGEMHRIYKIGAGI